MWRDEVRVFSTSTLTTWRGLFQELSYDGHPGLWYLLLRLGHLVAPSPLVLPVVAAAVAVAAVWLFAAYAPLPRQLRGLFAFGFFPLYEYAVSCRNYGVSMLLLFAYCAYAAGRAERPRLGGLLLALLASTNATAAILSGALTAGRLADLTMRWPRLDRLDRRRNAIGVGIAAAGLVLFVIQVLPHADSLPNGLANKSFRNLAVRGSIVLLASFWSVREGIAAGAPLTDTKAFAATAVGGTSLVSALVAHLLAFAVVIATGFRVRQQRGLLIALVLGLAGLGLFHGLVYTGSPRHTGLFFVFVVCIWWLAGESEHPSWPEFSLPRRSLVAITALFTLHAFAGAWAVQRDLRHELSASASFAAWVRQHPEYRGAILVGEPDYHLEAVPYYIPNATYYVREGEFRRWGRLTTDIRLKLTLAELLNEAQAIAAANDRPVLLLYGLGLSPGPSPRTHAQGTIRTSFGREFAWTRSEHDRFLREARLVASFRSALAERYEVYEIHRPQLPLPTP